MLSVRMRLFMFMRMHHSKPSQADSQGVMSDNILYNSQHLFPWKRVLYVHTQTPFASHSLSLSLSHTYGNAQTYLIITEPNCITHPT